MNHDLIDTIFIGGMNIDVIASGVDRFLNPGELTSEGKLIIGAGGKSRNMAHMTSLYSGAGRVAMIGKTVRDANNLWQIPVGALEQVGAITDYITIVPAEETDKSPTVAVIVVNKKGENQIYLLPGINEDFSPEDIENAHALFETVQNNHGILALCLELRLDTAIYAIKKANEMEIKVFFDPGGIMEGSDYSGLLEQKIHLIKPNEHEAQILTGVQITNFESAQEAAKIMLGWGIENVVITHGEKGAYVFNHETEASIPIPHLEPPGLCDATGCGDQTMAVLCAEMVKGKSLVDATKTAVLAGTLQFFKTGIQPLKREEVEDAAKQI
jgi:ribokinase